MGSDPPEHPLIAVKAMDARYGVARSAIKYGSLVLIAWILARAWVAAAGTATSLSLLVRLAADFGASKGLWVVVIVGGYGWAVGERALRRSQVKMMGARITELEKRIDPARSSSGLTVAGVTPQEETE